MSACAAAIVLLALAQSAAEEPDWVELFAALRGLEQSPADEDRALGLELLRVAAAEQEPDPRARVLAAQVARLGGAEGPTLALTSDEIAALDGEQSLAAAEVLAPEHGQDEALVRALETLPAERAAAAYTLGYARFVELDAEYRAVEALRLASALHARAQAGWSAANMAQVERRLGRTEEAAALLEDQLARALDAQEEAALLQDRALAWLGGGHAARARADLGAALARGSPDAGVVLGYMALEAGDHPRARAVFRPLLRRDPPEAWALRGWGLSMLPPNRAVLGRSLLVPGPDRLPVHLP